MNKRNMFYSNYNAGGFVDPNMQMNMQQPQGYSQSNYYQAYGPNVMPMQTQPNQYNDYDNFNDYETRITKLERQIRSLDARISKLETNTNLTEEINYNNDTFII